MAEAPALPVGWTMQKFPFTTNVVEMGRLSEARGDFFAMDTKYRMWRSENVETWTRVSVAQKYCMYHQLFYQTDDLLVGFRDNEATLWYFSLEKNAFLLERLRFPRRVDSYRRVDADHGLFLFGDAAHTYAEVWHLSRFPSPVSNDGSSDAVFPVNRRVAAKTFPPQLGSLKPYFPTLGGAIYCLWEDTDDAVEMGWVSLSLWDWGRVQGVCPLVEIGRFRLGALAADFCPSSLIVVKSKFMNADALHVCFATNYSKHLALCRPSENRVAVYHRIGFGEFCYMDGDLNERVGWTTLVSPHFEEKPGALPFFSERTLVTLFDEALKPFRKDVLPTPKEDFLRHEALAPWCGYVFRHPGAAYRNVLPHPYCRIYLTPCFGRDDVLSTLVSCAAESFPHADCSGLAEDLQVVVAAHRQKRTWMAKK